MSTRTATIGTQASHQLHPKLSPIPDLDNRRFCRACQCTLPVSAFPSGTRRYLCKRHIWERIQQPSKRRALANSHKKLLWMLWKRCWSDAKRTFKHERILLLQRDIEQTLAQIEESSQDSSQESTQEVAVDAVEAVLERRQGSFSVAKSTSSGGTSATVTKCICLSRSGNE